MSAPNGQASDAAKVTQSLARLSLGQLGADLILYIGPITRPYDEELIEQCSDPDRSKNAFVLLATLGGDPHVAYRIGRCLHRNYERVTVCAPGPCFSAGTLLAITGHELVMTDLGLLGPLDIQIQKSDELFEMTSGLTVAEAMETVRSEAWAMLEQTLVRLKVASSGQITLKTALETATALTIGTFQPLFAQIDPMRLGEDSRSTRVIEEYGKRLDINGQNLRQGALRKLVSQYPSHSFEIDREEAREELFKRVREPNEVERPLIAALEPFVNSPHQHLTVTRIGPANLQEPKEENHACQDGSRLSPGAIRAEASPHSSPPQGCLTEEGFNP